MKNFNMPLPFTEVCSNYLLTGRNVSTTTTTVYGSSNPQYIYDPSKALLNSKEEIDGQGHTKIGSWTAGVNDQNQYWQVREFSNNIHVSGTREITTNN